MKKILIIMLCLVILTGCTDGDTAAYNATNNFIVIDVENGIVYSKQTEICYYIVDAYCACTYTPFYDTDKQLMTKDEYIEKYKK